jgi:hypothetical protein
VESSRADSRKDAISRGVMGSLSTAAREASIAINALAVSAVIWQFGTNGMAPGFSRFALNPSINRY